MITFGGSQKTKEVGFQCQQEAPSAVVPALCQQRAQRREACGVERFQHETQQHCERRDVSQGGEEDGRYLRGARDVMVHELARRWTELCGETESPGEAIKTGT